MEVFPLFVKFRNRTAGFVFAQKEWQTSEVHRSFGGDIPGSHDGHPRTSKARSLPETGFVNRGSYGLIKN
jgi:hypothetical protein